MSAKDFQIISRLGEGSYSSVWKVKRFSDSKEYAMKKVKMNALTDKERQNALNEVRILASIQSPYIIGYKEAFFDDNSMTLCIVMEFASAGDMYKRIQQHIKNRTFFPEKEIWQAFIEILKALKVLHDQKILHRDLKCANVFFSADGTAKLGDLNVSKVAKNNLAHTQTGTPYYASPEVWRDQPYDAKSDIWSLGCVIYEMAALKPPFRATDMKGLFNKVQKGVFDRLPSQYSTDLSEVIKLCLQVSPTARPTCNQLLNHPLVIKNSEESNSIGVNPDFSNLELLSTIKVPRNMRGLGQQLPKSNYADLEEIKEQKGSENQSDSPGVRPNTVNEAKPSAVNDSKKQIPVNNQAHIKKPLERVRSADPRQKPLIAVHKSPIIGSNKTPLRKEQVQSPNPIAKRQDQRTPVSQNPSRGQIQASKALVPKSVGNTPQQKTPHNVPNSKQISKDAGKQQPNMRPMSHKPESAQKNQPKMIQRPASNYQKGKGSENSKKDPRLMGNKQPLNEKKADDLLKNGPPNYQKTPISSKDQGNNAVEKNGLQKQDNIYNLKNYEQNPTANKAPSYGNNENQVTNQVRQQGGLAGKEHQANHQIEITNKQQQQNIYYKYGVVRPSWWG